MSEDLFPLLADGNSRLARSARAKLQWRDRYGRWIEMGGGIKFKVRLSNGSTPSVNGTFVGAKSATVGQVYVTDNPSGLKNGFYDVSSGNAQEILTSLDPEYLKQRDIALGKDVSGNTVGSRIDGDIPNIDQIPFSEAPEGWNVTKRDANDNPVSFSTDDGDYGYDLATWGYPMMWKKDSETYTKVADWTEGLGHIDKIDKGEASWGDNPDGSAPAAAPGRAELEAKLAKLNEQYPKTTNAAALRRLDAQIEEIEAQLEGMPEGDAPEEGADAPAAPSNGIDTDTHSVAKEGFIVPTGKKAESNSPDSIAQLIERERDYLTEGSGQRLVVDDAAGTAEIYTSADTLNNAKAQAGGIGAPEFIDLATGETIPNDKNVGAPEGNTNPEGAVDPKEKFGPTDAEIQEREAEAAKNGITLTDAQARKQIEDEAKAEKEQAENDQDGNSDSEQSRGDDSGADAPVGDSGDEPDSSGAGDGDGGDRTDTDIPADSGDGDGDSTRESNNEGPDSSEAVELTRAQKEEKLNKLYERHAKAKNPDVLDTLDREIAALEADLEGNAAPDVEARLDDISEKLADIQEKLDTETPNPTATQNKGQDDGTESTDSGGGSADSAVPGEESNRPDGPKLDSGESSESGATGPLGFSEVSAEDFNNTFSEYLDQPGAAPEDFIDPNEAPEGTKNYVSEDGRSGFQLDGTTIRTLFNTPGGSDLTDVIASARQAGATRGLSPYGNSRIAYLQTGFTPFAQYNHPDDYAERIILFTDMGPEAAHEDSVEPDYSGLRYVDPDSAEDIDSAEKDGRERYEGVRRLAITDDWAGDDETRQRLVSAVDKFTNTGVYESDVKNFFEAVGYRGAPKVAESPFALDSAEGTRLYRIILAENEDSARTRTEEFRNGTSIHQGLGNYGSGTYTSKNENVFGSYGSAQTGTAGILDISLDADAKIITEAELENLKDEILTSLGLSTNRTELYYASRTSPLAAILTDNGLFAAALGFDALQTSVSDYVVILNHSSISVAPERAINPFNGLVNLPDNFPDNLSGMSDSSFDALVSEYSAYFEATVPEDAKQELDRRIQLLTDESERRTQPAANVPETPDTASWAANPNRPTREELENAPEGARVKRTHRESMDELTLQKVDGVWRFEARDGSISTKVRYGVNDLDMPRNFFLEVLDNKAPEADAPEAPAAPEPWEESGRPAAEVYDKLVNDFDDPEVQKSYESLTDAVIDQFREMKAMGINMEFSQEDPYKNSAEMQNDVLQNNRLKVFADGGATLPDGHPMKRNVNVDGEEYVLNDVFRGVHDYFGHVVSADRGAVVSFGPKGEWEAWRTHRLTLPRESWMALWTETRGQNTWTNYANNNLDLPIQDRPFAEQKVGVVPEDVYAADLIGTEPEASVATPEVIDLDPTGDLNAQIQAAIDSGAEVRFQYTSNNGTKIRTVKPERLWNNPKQGHDVLSGTDTESGEARNFILNKMEAIDPTDTSAKSVGDMSSEEIQAELDAYDFETADSATRQRIFDLTMEQGWRGEAPGFGSVDEEDLPQEPSIVNAERANNRLLREKSFSGLTNGSPIKNDENGEPHDSAAVFDLEDREELPDAPATDVLPQNAGQVDDFAVPEEPVSFPSDGVTPTREPSDLSDKISASREAARRAEFGYQDKDEDYADEKFMPTQEQRDIIMAVLGENDVAVQALAGTGKTSTLELMARRIQKEFPDKKILYIAFNKSVQEEAESRMPGNVESRTGDSLGWVGISKDLTKKRNNATALTLPRDIAANFDIRDTNFGGETSMDAEDIVRDLLQVINKFTISDADSIGASHFEDLDLPFNERTKAWADEMWADINDKNGQLKFTNSHATKIWALTGPDLSKLGSGVRKPADIIFFDEAQDINPVMAKIVRDQGIQKVYVGDGRQAIYGFRGAENELDNVDVDFTLPLTQSWRFGPEVAGYGNRYLSLIGSPLKIVGGGPNGEVLPAGTMNDPDAVLTRSNAGAVKAILEQIGLGRTVGASSKFKTDLQSLIQTVRWLKFNQGRKPRIHDDLQGYKSWDDINRDVDRGKASAKVEMLFNLVENMGIDTLQTAVDALRNADKKENKDNKDMGGVDYTLGASGSLGEVEGKFGPVKLSYAITAGKDKELRLAVTNAFPIKDRLKEVGFRFNGDDKTWYLEGSADELRSAFSEFVENDSAPIDVVVSTAHKAKGLEWGRVKIGDDFRGPRTVVDDNGDEITEWPSPEELRLAYVAVTRAQGALDPGSLAWVEGYTDTSDERPDVPSRGLPGEDGYDETPAPTPEPEQTPVEVVPEPTPTPAPEVVDAPVDEDDDLPDDINELEILAGKLERRIVNAPPRQARVLEIEVAKIYDKIQRLEDFNAIQDAPDAGAPEPVVPDGPDPDVAAVSESIVRAFAEGKDLSPEKTQEVNDLVESGEVEAAKSVLSREPNKANTATKTKPLPEYATPIRQDRARAPRDPLFEEEPNEVLRELKRDFPDFEQREDGDIVIQKKTISGREYNIVVRRTNREKFYAYAEEIDLATGKRRVIFLRQGGKQNHSYKALMTQVNKGQKMMAPALPKKAFDRKRTGILRLEKGEVIPTNPLDSYITGTDLPTSKNDVYNRVVAAIAQLVEDPNVARAALEALATKNGFSSKLVDAVGAAVLRNKVANAMDRPGFDAPTHVSYDGRVVEVGQWVDWTDTDRTIAQTDEFGNTIYGPDGKALNKPNPNYGKVFRGYVQRMIPRKETNKGGLYAYTDNVWAIFPEYNVSRGLKPAYQRLRTSAGLTIVPSQNAPATPAFFGPGRVERVVAQPESFDVPVDGSVDTKPRPARPARAGWAPADLQVAEAGIWEVHPNNPDLRLPASRAQLVEILDNALTVLDIRQNIQPGDMMITGLDGRLPEIVVSNVDVNGVSVLTIGRFNGNSYEFKDVSISTGVEFTVFRPRPEDVDASNVSPSALRQALIAKMASKEMPAKLRGEMIAALAKDDISIEEFGNIAETLAALKDAPESNNMAPLKNVLEEVRDAALSNPELAGAPGVADIGDALRAVDQDMSLPLPTSTPQSDIYNGQPVKTLKIEDINAGEDGEDFFLYSGPPSRASVGDLISYGFEMVDPKTNEYSNRRGYFQITGVETRNGINTRLTGRVIVPGNMEDGFEVRRMASSWAPDGGRGIFTVDLFDGFLINQTNILTPSAEMADDYFVDAQVLRDIRNKPRRQASVTEKTTADDPEQLEVQARAVKRLLSSYGAGVRIDVARTPPQGGAVHVRGTAQYLTAADGKKIFTKEVRSEDDVNNEVMAMRVANALGIESNHAASPESMVVIMDLIEGQLGTQYNEAQGDSNAIQKDFVDDMENRPDVLLMGVLDYIIGNGDRNSGNYFVTPDNKIVPIDHGNIDWEADEPDPRYSRFAHGLLDRIRDGNSPISSAELLRLKNQVGALRSEFVSMGMIHHWAGMMNAMNKLIDGVNGYAI